QRCEAAARWSETPFVVDGVHVYVDDVDGHFERARAGGARILSEVEDTPFGDRHYRVEDLEGHRWMFAERVREVPAEDWGAVGRTLRSLIDRELAAELSRRRFGHLLGDEAEESAPPDLEERVRRLEEEVAELRELLRER